METTITDAGNLRKQVTLTVAASEVNARREELIDRYAGQIKLKGFRPGKKPPRSMVAKRLGRGLDQECNDGLIQEGISKGIQDNNLKPVGPVSIDESDTSDGIKHTVSFDVRPEITLPEPKSLGLENGDTDASDDEVEEELSGLSRRTGTYKDLNEGDSIEKDDVLTLSGNVTSGDETVREVHDLQHLLGGYPLFGLEADDVVTKAESVKVGEALSFDTTLPDGFTPEEWVGKEASVSLTVQTGRRLEAAPIDDEFAKKFGADDVAGLKERVKTMIEGRKSDELREKQSEELLDKLVAGVSFDLPESLLNNLVEERVNRAKQGDEGEAEAEVDEAKEKAEAEKELRRWLLVETIADEFNVQATRQDVEQQVAMAAYQSGRKPEDVAKQLQESGRLPEVAAEIRSNKAVALFLDKALDSSEAEAAETATAEA